MPNLNTKVFQDKRPLRSHGEHILHFSILFDHSSRIKPRTEKRTLTFSQPL
jgi:hypothetical protein